MKSVSARALFSTWSNSGWAEYWLLFALSLTLLLWADLATTLVAADIYGLGAEANPIMRWLLSHGFGVTVLVHLAVFIFAAVGFRKVVEIGRSLDGSAARRYRFWCLAWLGGLLAIGFAVVVNNLTLVLVAVDGPI